ncbi:MAG: hypothetical protein IT428_30220 [Planctomycetaceae bacterium]|nr:hypothetical protein [Planctomycetaceae bacterium]
MPHTIADEILTEARLTERAAEIEIAGRLFDAGRLTLWLAARWVGLGRVDLESEWRVQKNSGLSARDRSD